MNKNTITNENIVFSGTDNGIVTMTITVGLTLHRFKLHLELYNIYDALSDTDDKHSMDDIIQQYNTKEDGYNDLLKRPICTKITTADIDVGARHKKARRKLERRKKTHGAR